MKQLENNIGTIKDLVLHRLETAKSDINSAKILLDAGEYRSNNLKEKGITLSNPIRYDWGTYELRLKDINGNEIVIVEFV